MKEKKIRVLHIIGALYQGGTEQQIENFLMYSDNKLFDHQVVSFYGTGDVGKRIQKKWPVTYYHPKVSPRFSLQSIIATISSYIKIYSTIKQYKPDIIHSYLPHANILSRLVIRGNIKHISSIRVKEIARPLEILIDKLTSSFTDIYITNSQSIAKHIKKNICSNKQKIKVIRNGTELPRKKYCDLKLPIQGKKVILMVANFRKQKDHETLFLALKKLQEKHNDFICLLAGSGNEEARLKKRVKDLKIATRVEFIGVQKNIYGVFDICDVSVLSTNYEGTPNVIIESMLMKKPLVATNLPEIREIITANKEGLLFSKGNYHALFKHLEEILYHAKDTSSMTDAAYQKARKEFSIQQLVEKTQNCYKQLL